MAEEQVAIVDESDREIGVTSRADSIAQKLRARIVFIYVIDPATQKIAVTQRGPDLAYQPLAWQPSAGGYVAHGESYEQAATRELREELGISPPLVNLCTVPFQDDAVDLPFMFSFFVGCGDPLALKADPREIVDIRFMTLDEAETMGRVLPNAEQGDLPRLHSAYGLGLHCLRDHWDKIVNFSRRS